MQSQENESTAGQACRLGDDQAALESEAVDEGESSRDEAVGRAFRWSLAVLAGGAALAYLGWLLLAPIDEGDVPATRHWDPAGFDSAQFPADEFPDVPFTEITQQAGIDFVHFDGATGKLMMPENVGSGCAFFDYDNDGDQDLLLVNSCSFPGHEQQESPTPRGLTPRSLSVVGEEAPRPTAALYQNDGHGCFRNVTAGSGLDVSLYGMGLAVGDYDGDGRTDVFLSALGPNRLFRNLGDGRFEDVTGKAGVAGEPRHWSTSAGFLDYDNDGDLDLFVCNYVDWSEALDDKLDHYMIGVQNYLPPWHFLGTHNYLYRNDGQGTFTEVSREAGIQVSNAASGVPKGKGLGVVFCDLVEDGWLEIVVANDAMPVFLYHNQRNGKFAEIGEASGIANGHDGLAISGMGIDMGQIHDDGRITVGIGNINGNPEAMFVSQGDPLKYVDAVQSLGIAIDSQLYTTWGLFFFDVDLDGRLDMFQCNGSVVSEGIDKLRGISHLQPSQLFWNRGSNQTCLSALPLGNRSPALERPLMARGAAYADIDGDGDLDLVITQNARPPVLLRNDQRLGNHWLRLQLEGDGGNREALGARIEVRVAGQLLRRRVMPTRSYLSQVELPVTVGLGKQTQLEQVRVIWPDGTQQMVADVQVDQLTRVRKTTVAGGQRK